MLYLFVGTCGCPILSSYLGLTRTERFGEQEYMKSPFIGALYQMQKFSFPFLLLLLTEAAVIAGVGRIL